MENTSIYKLAVSIAFCLHVVAIIPTAASLNTPAILLEHGLHIRDTDTTTIVTSPTTYTMLVSTVLLIIRQHVTGEGVCILISGEEACSDGEYHPSSYCKRYLAGNVW